MIFRTCFPLKTAILVKWVSVDINFSPFFVKMVNKGESGGLVFCTTRVYGSQEISRRFLFNRAKPSVRLKVPDSDRSLRRQQATGRRRPASRRHPPDTGRTCPCGPCKF